VFHRVLTAFHHQKSVFKESSFCHLCQHFFTMPSANKHFDAEAKKAGSHRALEGQVPPEAIMKQLGMSKTTLMRVLAIA
jgi:hypothetical protein